MSREPWDDERIADAYRDLTGGPVPAEVRAAIGEARKARPAARRTLRSVAILAAAASVIIAVGALTMMTSRRPAVPIASGQPVSTPQLPGGATPGPAGPPPLTVPELLAIQGGTFDDRELQVQGYLSARLALPCPAPIRQPTPLEPSCPNSSVWLMAHPEILVTHSGSGTSYGPPTGPAINPRLLETSGLPPFGGEDDPPVEVVAFGHFDDARWRACPGDLQETCRQQFVIDRIVAPGEQTTMGFPEPWAVETVARHTAADVFDHLSRLERTLLQVMSVGSVDGAELGRIEPATVDEPELVAPGAVWLIRILDPDGSGSVRTFVVRDEWLAAAASSAWELTAEGPSIVLDRTIVTIESTLAEQCGSEGGCAYDVRLEGPDGAHQTTDIEPPGAVSLDPPFTPGTWSFTFEQWLVSDVSLNGASPGRSFDTSCTTDVAIDPPPADIRIAVSWRADRCLLLVESG